VSSLDYIKWDLRAKQKRWDALRKILDTPWTGDRGWEGRTIGLHLPLEMRNFAIRLQEKLGLKSMKEVLFKALVVGLRELDAMPRVTPAPPRYPPLREVTLPSPADEEAATDGE